MKNVLSPSDVGYASVRCERRDSGIMVLIIDNPPVNALSHEVRAALLAHLETLADDASIQGVVIAGQGNSFIAGADIREMSGPLMEPGLPTVIEVIDGYRKPVVAAIGRFALGGGMEVALACHKRVAADNAKLGFPEVRLGVIPGAGGIPRLIRLIDPTVALDLVASGRQIDTTYACELGLIDLLVPAENLVQAAEAMAASLAATPLSRLSHQDVVPFDQDAFRNSSRRLLAKANGQLSVKAAIDAVNASTTLAFKTSAARTRRDFLDLRRSEQAAALRYQFFAERAAQQIAGSQGKARVQRIAIIGAGMMGCGMATACLKAGYQVHLVERNSQALLAARPKIAQSLSRVAKTEGWAEGVFNKRLSELSASDGLADIGDCDLVIEAVFEDEAVKRNVLAAIEKLVRPDTVLATNTSYLKIGNLAQALENPARLIGLHFFAPAEVMRLVEIVPVAGSASESLSATTRFAQSLGKIPVMSGDAEGFIVNRVLAAYRREMEELVRQGIMPQDIDSALESFGMALGPFATADLSGLDIAWARRKRLVANGNLAASASLLADKLCELGRFGRKVGAGWYLYEDGVRKVDPSISDLVIAESSQAGYRLQSLGHQEIVDRAVAVMIREACLLLEESVSLRASDIDVAIVNGLAFPAWRGGPLYHADEIGLGVLIERLKASGNPIILPNLYHRCARSEERISDQSFIGRPDEG